MMAYWSFMAGFARLPRHLSVVARAALALAMTAPAAAQAPGAQVVDSATFDVMSRGVRIGTEVTSLSHAPSGWEISSTGRLAAPVDLTTTRFDLRYSEDWQPQQLSIEGELRGQLITLGISFGLTTASIEAMRGGQHSSLVQNVTARTVVVPTSFFGAYAALAPRIAKAPVGTAFSLYFAPDAEAHAVVARMFPHHLVTPDGPVDLRQIDLNINDSSGLLTLSIWLDAKDRLARVDIPWQGMTALRDDLSSVMTREERIRNPGDETAFIPGVGFAIAATVTHPAAAAPAPSKPVRLPAVVLVAGSGLQDRDETREGIPIFGQLAGGLAAQGYVVVRYDKRGLGQSGGRAENATIDEYADDVSHIVEWLRQRKDVDRDRIALVGYDEGGAIALSSAQHSKVAAIALVGAGGKAGDVVTLDQQRHAVTLLNETDASKQAKIDLEKKIISATKTGRGWEGIPPELQRQADTAWFRSWLTFDPARVVPKLRQPILALTGALDTEMAPSNADAIATLAGARKKMAPEAAAKVIVPGVNHLLVPAKTGETTEYGSLGDEAVAPAVVTALASWLATVMPPRK
jgi:pimeloyl-ACP methyl ester carboxylesterase